MKKYLHQLHTDLRSAHRPEKDWSEDSLSFEQHLEEVERYLNFEEEVDIPTFGESCDINKVVFPPAEKLQPQQIKSLIEAIKNLLLTWNISLDLPDTLPLEQVYFFYVEIFDTPVMILEAGMVGVDFCEEDFNLCPFGDAHCTCKKGWEEMEAQDQIYDEQVQKFIKDLDKKLSPTNEKMKVPLRFEEVEITETETQPIHTIAEWLEISMEDFPDSFPLWEKRADQISKIIMRLWHPEDEMILILNALEWEKRYNALKNHLNSKVWFDGDETMYFLPMSEEERAKLRSPLDGLDFGDTDDDLPF